MYFDQKPLTQNGTGTLDTPNSDIVHPSVEQVNERSERARLIQNLADCLELNQRIISEAPVGILLYKATGQCILANETAATLTGSSRQQLLQQNFHQINSWQEVGLLRWVKQLIANGTTNHSSFHFTSSFGKELWLDCRVTPLIAHNELHLLLIMTDMAEQQQTQTQAARQQAHLEALVQARTAELQQSNARLQQEIAERKQAEEQLLILSRGIEQSPVSIMVTDTTGAIGYVNPKFTQLTGYSLEEVKGKNPRILKSGETATEEYRTLWKTLLDGGEWQGELHNRGKNGNLFWESAVISPIISASGKITHFLAIKEDITERKQREREQSALLNLAMALRAANRREEMLPAILEQSARLVDAPIAAFASYEAASGGLVVEAALRQGQPMVKLAIPMPPGEGLRTVVLQSSESHWTDDVLADPRFLFPNLAGKERFMGYVPLIVDGHPLGLLWLMRKNSFTQDEERLLSAVADMAAVALQRANLHDRVTRYATDLEQEVALRTRELATANERLQELDRLKSKFVSDVTHELRTPVTNIGLYLALVEHKPEKQKEYMAILHGQVERLQTLVKDTLDLARLDQHQDALTLEPLDLNKLTSAVVAAHHARAEKQNLALIFEQETNLPSILGDFNKLTQVITNLVANALNYTPSGQVTIRTALDTKNLAVSCEISDTGCGIYDEDIPHLFDRFYRGKRDQMAPVPGTGFGLSIVKEIVELHGGAIHVTSDVGLGSSFTISLPISQPFMP